MPISVVITVPTTVGPVSGVTKLTETFLLVDPSSMVAQTVATANGPRSGPSLTSYCNCDRPTKITAWVETGLRERKNS